MHELHREEQPPFPVESDVVYRNDGRVLELGGRLSLTVTLARGINEAELGPRGVLAGLCKQIDRLVPCTSLMGLDTFEDDDLKVARMTLSEPVDRGRVVMEFLVGTKAGVTRLRDEHEMGWFTRDEYESAFRYAGLSVRYDVPGHFSRGLYTGRKK